MKTGLTHALKIWSEAKSSTEWVLASVYKTEGSSYRKSGAMMLINGYGQQYGMLSGGCLEADIVLNAKKVMAIGKSLTITYDTKDEDSLSYQLGLGCGGVIHILLQPITNENDLGLMELKSALESRQSCLFHQKISQKGEVVAFCEVKELAGMRSNKSYMATWQDEEWLITPILPDHHLLVVGGGMDAIPVVNIAKELGWKVTVCDPRAANARKENFPAADNIIKTLEADFDRMLNEEKPNAAIVMSHSISIDASSIAKLYHYDLNYLSLLGPAHRKEEVLELAGVKENEIPFPFFGPAGLSLGGEHPESVALSMMSQCHGVLEGGTCQHIVMK